MASARSSMACTASAPSLELGMGITTTCACMGDSLNHTFVLDNRLGSLELGMGTTATCGGWAGKQVESQSERGCRARRWGVEIATREGSGKNKLNQVLCLPGAR